MRKKKMISFSLSEEIIEKIKSESDELGLSNSSFVEFVIRDYIKKKN